MSSQAQALATRLGERATVDDPFLGRRSTLADLRAHLTEMATWLGSHDASFESFGLVTGSDRDVTEGALSITVGGRRARIPVGIVVERRRERAVELRAYYATDAMRDPPGPRRETLPRDEQSAVPPPVAAYLDALARGDVDAAVASFERGGTVRDARGETHAKLDPDAGPLGAYFRSLFTASADGGATGIRLAPSARADDGRACAVEYTVTAIHGKEIVPQPALAVFERGESGLLRTVRHYDDVGI